MRVRVAYIEEPPFYWTGPDGRPTGADIDLADAVLRAIGATDIAYQLTSFGELLPGVQQGRWDMNVPIFVTPERSTLVTFSSPVWALGDGFLAARGNPKALTSYKAVAERGDARLGVVVGTVQIPSARLAGVVDRQIVVFDDQPSAVTALLSGKIDAYAATAVGNRALAAADKALEAVAHENSPDAHPPTGGFSFNKDNHALIQAVNHQLRAYLGTPEHRARMAKYGIGASEIDSVVAS